MKNDVARLWISRFFSVVCSKGISSRLLLLFVLSVFLQSSIVFATDTSGSSHVLKNAKSSKVLKGAKKPAPGAPIPGCTYNQSSNYSAAATLDSGNCDFSQYLLQLLPPGGGP